MTRTFDSWLSAATYADGHLTLTMSGVTYHYTAPPWVPGLLAAWSAGGGSVGKLYHAIKGRLERIEVETCDVDLSGLLVASLGEAAA